MTPYIIKDIYHYCNVSVNKCKQINKHRISYYDLTFVLKGSMTYVADDQTYVLNENDAILLPPGTVRQRMAGTQKVQYVSFNFQILPNCELLISPFLKGPSVRVPSFFLPQKIMHGKIVQTILP